jgi:MinD-like ATPase involved in chromosome partitioning or flagellar assembly
LGKVIFELAEKSTKKKQAQFINFRASKLTHLLKDSLGGNSRTIMICTLNPHSSAIKETLSTLKFAQRAKMIRQQAIVNEENNDAEYWRQKYLALQEQLQTGQPIQIQSKSSHSGESVEKLARMLSDKNSQLADANLTLQTLTKQLTEATETQDELRATFLRS